MRLAAHTYAFRDRPLEAALDEVAALGLGLVEIWLGHAGAPAHAARSLAERGLAAAAVSAGSLSTGREPAASAAFELAAATGAPVVVTCAVPQALAPLATQAPDGVTVCLENHWDHACDRPAAVRAALRCDGRLRACVDTGHAVLAGVRADAFVTGLAPLVGHVHLKDAARPPAAALLLGRRLRRRLLPRPSPVAPGRGDVPVQAVRRALEAASYRGVVSLEHEGPDPAAALRELLALWRQPA